MTDPVSNDPVAGDAPEHPGGDRSSGSVESTGAEQPPAADALADVSDNEAAQHADDLGDDVAQPDDHPYDKDSDPDSEPKAVTGSAGGTGSSGTGSSGTGSSENGKHAPGSGPGATLSTDVEHPWYPHTTD